jgi:ATP-binding cassette subfamily B protein RaxB
MEAGRQLHLRFWTSNRLPVCFQSERAECGLACLAMIAGYWGHRVDLLTLRRRFSISLKGANLAGLIGMAQSLRLAARPVKVELDALRQLALPCVLHWDMNHFVVLQAVERGAVVIHDPAMGKRRLSMQEVSRRFTGIALELKPDTGFEKRDEAPAISLSMLMGRVVGLRSSVLQLLALGCALQACTLLAPFFLQWVVDQALVAADRELISVLGIGFLILVVLQSAIGAIRSWVTTTLATNLNFHWFSSVFAHLMRLPLSFFERRHLGDVVSRFGSIQAIQRSLTTQFVEGLLDGFLVLGTLAVMLAYSFELAVVATLAVVLYALLRWSIFDALRQATFEQIIHSAKQHSHLLESVRGVQTIRLFNGSEERRIGWMNLLADQMNAELRIARLSISHQTANSLLFGAERIVVIWLAALAVLDARFTAGMLFAFISYKDQFSQRMSALIDRLFEVGMLRLHAQRLADIVLAQAENHADSAGDAIARTAATIEFRNVSFRYADSEPHVIQDLSLHIPCGQCIAITGSSGCGKTTLIKLLLGLLEPTKGEILVNGTPIGRVGLANYRQLIGTVMQEDQLFSGSVADNISFFDPLPDPQRIRDCGRWAAIDEELCRMPMGYHTLVGDVGSGLSGGQTQRILLARALYRDPQILVMDEATSHLDVGNEQLINAAVRQFKLTRILVAHRPETIAMAQRVIQLQNGSVARDFEQTVPTVKLSG